MVKIQIKYTSSISEQVTAFEDRVIADGGTFEAAQCCIDFLKTLGNDAEYGGYLDVKEGSVFPLNFSVGDIRDLTSRSGTFSKTITLVGSKNNNNILNHYYDVNIAAGTFDINKVTRCAVIQDGIPIIEDGLLQLLSVKKTQVTDAYEQGVEYEVLIKDTRIEFFTAIANKELTALDFSDLNHTFTATDIIDSFNNTVVDGFKYVMPYVTNNNLQVRLFKPAIYAKTYLDRIFSSAGFQYEWSDLTASRFDKLLIPYNGDANTFDAQDYLVEAQLDDIQTLKPTNSFSSYDDVTGWTEISDPQSLFDATTGIYTIPFDTSSVAGQGYTVEYEINYEFYVDNTNSVTVYNMYNGYYATPRIALSVEGYQQQVSNICPQQVIGFGFALAPGVHQFSPVASGIKTGSIIATENALNSEQTNVNNELTIQIGFQQGYTAWFTDTSFPFTPAPDPVYSVLNINSIRVRIIPTGNIAVIGGTLNINQYIPLKVKQSDFVKSIFQMYNLFAETDINQPNKLILKHRDEYYDSGAEKDWTYKLMKDREQDLIFLPDITSKKLKLTYKEDKDSPNVVFTQMTEEIYGQLEYTFDNEYVKGTETKELIFSPTPVVPVPFGAYVPAIDGEAPKTNIRILYDGGKQTCGSWNLVEYGTTGVFGATSYPMLGHFDNALTPTFDINFGTCDYYFYSPSTLTANNLYNLYWRRTVNQINVGKMLVAYFNLNEADIQTLKLNDKIRIDNSWWNINKVIDYDANSNAPTKVELISIDTEIDLPPFITKPGTPTPPTTTAVSVDSILMTKSSEANSNLSGDDVIVKGVGNNIGDGLKGLVIGDNKILQEDGIITPQINGASIASQTYVALLSQSGTNPPDATILADNIGGITWTRTAQGEYLGTPVTPLSVENTFVIVGNVEHDYQASAYVTTDGNISLITCRNSGHQHEDDKLRNSPIEVRIYG
jgi:hypothetical protein